MARKDQKRGLVLSLTHEEGHALLLILEHAKGLTDHDSGPSGVLASAFIKGLHTKAKNALKKQGLE